ncbi:ParB/RepB/Spo0J family partition protein, partial [Cereibacter sphaeroides]
MTSMQADFTPTPEVIALDDLTLSALNPRQTHDEASIALLAESLVTCGLMQNLGGYRDAEGRVAIVFGGRRLAALRIAVQQRPDLAQVPVALAPDEDTARLWAQSENIAREALAPVDEIRAYGRMRDAGATVPQIAQAFGSTEAHVYRRLKLADLPGFVLDALAAQKITLGVAACFTVANDLDLAQEAMNRITGQRYACSEHEVRRWLQPEAVGPSDRRV